MMKSCSVFHVEQKMVFEKFNCFFIDFLRHSFGRIKVIPTVVERKYTPDITWQICFSYQLTDFYMLRGFTERYFLTDYSYILENHFYFVNVPDYCFKPSLSRIFCVNSSVKIVSYCLLNSKVLRPIYFVDHYFAHSLITEKRK